MRHARTPNQLYTSANGTQRRIDARSHEPCYSVKEIAEKLGITPNGVRARLDARTLPQPDLVSGFTVKHLFWKRSTIDRYLRDSETLC